MNSMKKFCGVVIASSLLVLAAGCKKEAAPAPEAPVASQPAAKPPAVPIPSNHIYDENADPKADIAAAQKKAKAEHKNVILDFGGDWCGDCQVLYYYLHKSPNAEVLEKNFVLVPVWIGRMDHNVDIAATYGVPIAKGVPALAVLDGQSGKVIYSQAKGEFADMRHMDEKYATDFLDRWKP